MGVQAGAGPSTSAMLVELQHALIKGLTSEMLRHEVRGVLRPQGLSELEVLLVLPPLDPEAVYIHVPLPAPFLLAIANAAEESA